MKWFLADEDDRTDSLADSNKHFYRFGALGSPDIVCIGGGRYVGIEVKDVKGRLNNNQIEFQRRLEAAGGLYILAERGRWARQVFCVNGRVF